ncbi:MAG: flippase-like domain-containing protein [Candidatus Eiseniibacteriota bacterium]|nr:MAG: flippase-like domain-containing protein [Candidatus Eisenbacteria bacterium]
MDESNHREAAAPHEVLGDALEDRPKATRREKMLKRLIVLVKMMVSLSLLVYLLYQIKPGNFVDTMLKARPEFLAWAALLFLSSNLLGSWQWGMLLRAQGVRIPFYRVASFYFVGLFFNNFLPANIGGDIVRIYDAARYCKDRSAVFIATFMDRVIGLLAISFLAVVAAAFSLDHYKIFLLYLTVVLGFCGSLFVVLSILNRRILAVFEKPFKLIKAFEINRRVTKLFDELHSFRDKLPLLMAVLSLAVGIQVLRVFVHYLVARSLGIELSPSYFFLFVPVLAALSALPVSINGLGVREGAGVVLFGLVGVAAHQAFSLEFMTYLVGVAISLSGGVIFFLRTPLELMRRRAAPAGASPPPVVNNTDGRK